MIKVYPAAGARLASLQIGEHTLTFGQERWADGSMLSADELDRLARFHFHIEREDDKSKPVETVDNPVYESSDSSTENASSAKRSKRGKATAPTLDV